MPPSFTLNQIIAQLQTQWGGDNEGTTRDWSGTTVRYGLPNTSPDRSSMEQAGFTAMDLTQKSFVRRAFDLWNDLIAIDLVEETGSPATTQITFAYSTTTNNDGTYATPFLVALPPGGSTFEREIAYERIWFSQSAGWPENQSANLGWGRRGFENMIHEIGHSLGLSHPGSYNAGDVPAPTYNADAEYTQDTLEWTVMSYFNAGADGTAVDRTGTRDFDGDGTGDTAYAATPLLHDILAIQAKYGANMTTRTGNDTYGFNISLSGPFRGSFDFSSTFNPDPVIAIWDAGGIDTLDTSGYTQNQKIDLAPGAISDVGALTHNVAIAYGTTIENAVGGSGNDWIKGNGVANNLYGRNGSDTLEGFDGNDLLDQGEGGGGLYGGNHNDTLIAGPGAETLDGGNGVDRVDYSRSLSAIQVDTLYGKVIGGHANGDTLISIEQIIATNFDDVIGMDDGNNLIVGGFGNDQLDGRGGADVLQGGEGNDYLRGGAGADYIDGGNGYDVAGFGTAVTINLSSGVHGGEAAGDTFVSIEEYAGSPDSDTMIANANVAARFAGGDGVDYLYGGNRDDWLQGGKGADYINGGAGFDMVSYADAPSGITAELYFNDGTTDGKITAGEWGLDTLVSIEDVEGTNFNDILYGDERSNKLVGLGGDDEIEGREGSDILDGGAGNDSILADASDFVDGGPGIDTLTVSGGALYYNLTTNTFQVGGQGFYAQNMEIFVGTSGNDSATGAGGSDTISLGAGNDGLYGMGGDDFLYTGPGADVMDGGPGRDTMVFHKAMVADWQSGVLDPDIQTDSWYNWEIIQGSAGADRIRTNSWGFSIELRGGDGDDVLATGVSGVVGDILLGEGGNDDLNGGAGNDTLDGGTGNDTLVGGPGNDILRFAPGSGADIVSGFQDGLDRLDLTGYAVEFSMLGLTRLGADTRITLSGGNWVTLLGVLPAVITAVDFVGLLPDGGPYVPTSNSDSLYGTFINDSINGLAGNDTINALDGNDTVLAVSGNDSVAGGSGNDSLNGGTGDDRVDGGAGNDTLIGSAGNDTLIGADGSDSIAGGGGNDGIVGGLGNDTVNGDAGNDSISGDAGNDDLTGSYGNDTIDGGTGDDKLSGGGNDDLLYGGDGIDTLFGFEASDTLYGGAGSDTLRGGLGGDVLYGENGDDRLLGEEHDDTLDGGAGDDTLIGGTGQDLLTGGAGNDTFIYQSVDDSPFSGRDTITGIDGIGPAAGDIINLQAIDANAVGGGANDAFIFIGTAAFFGPGQLRVANNGTDTVIQGNTDANTSTIELLIRVTDGAVLATAWDASDFVL